MRAAAAASAMALLAAASAARAGDVHVPGDVRNLQRAVDSALPGDRILFDRGTHRGELVVTVPDVEIVGGPKARIVGNRRTKRALLVLGAGVTVRGVAFVRGSARVLAPSSGVVDGTFRASPRGRDVLALSGREAEARGNRFLRTCRGERAIDADGQDAVVAGNSVAGGRLEDGIHVRGDGALVAGNDVAVAEDAPGIRVEGDLATVLGNRATGGGIEVVGDGGDVRGNRVEGAPLGRASLHAAGDRSLLVGNEVSGGLDTGILVLGDDNVAAMNSVTGNGSVVDGNRVGHGFVVRGTANLLAGGAVDGCVGEGFRITGNGGPVLVTDPLKGTTELVIVTGPGNLVRDCTATGAGTCGIGNWTYGTGVTGSTFTGNGVDVVDGHGFDAFNGNTWNTGGPGFEGSGAVNATASGDVWNVGFSDLGGD